MTNATRAMQRIVFLATFVLTLSIAAGAYSLPRMSITSGAPCATCHVNHQGGGMRSEIGWGMSSMMGAWEYDEIGLGFLARPMSNEIIDELVSIGLDVRVQMARMGRPGFSIDDDGQGQTEMPERKIIPMQLQPYLAVTPHHTLTLYGTYNINGDTFEGDLCETHFDGQSCYEAQVLYRPSPKLPAIRAGMLQPSIGIRHDDHTMLLRHDAARPRGTLIPPNYAELGAELTYTPRYWLQTEVGGFQANNLALAVGNGEVTSSDDVAYLGRIAYMPRVDFDSFSVLGMMGVSTFGAGDFRMDNVFIGAGLPDRLSVFVEAALLHYGDTVDREGRNLSTTVALQTWEWLVFEARIEEARTFLNEELHRTRAATLGLQFFPVPYVELRPEYRYQRTETYAMAQYALQLHLFF